MRYQILVGACAAAVLSLTMPTPAQAQTAFRTQQSDALKWELGYIGLNAIDAVQTIHCLDRGKCTEGNPIFGRHPSTTKLILGKLGFGLLHFAAFSHMNDRNPKAAMRFAQVSCFIQGGVVLLNARIAF